MTNFRTFLVAMVMSVATGFLYGQVWDNFNDGTIKSFWLGDRDSFIVNSIYQLQLNATVAGKVYLSAPMSLPSEETVWSFRIRENFAPSANNLGYFYLMSDKAVLTDSLINGYYLRFGENLSNDAVRLFRQQGRIATSTLICSSTEGAIAAAFDIKVKVTRSPAGHWTLSVANASEDVYTVDTCTDNTITSMAYTGLVCQYTVTNRRNFYFDDIYCGETRADTVVYYYYSTTICQGEAYSDSNFTDLTQAGTYYDTLQNSNGCDSIVCLTLMVYPKTPLTYYSATICQGEAYSDSNFTDLTQAGTYYDTLQNSNGCDSVIELTLTVNSMPAKTAIILINSNILLASSANNYQWYHEDTLIGGATQQFYICTQSGKYYVEVSNEYGCKSISESINVTIVGIAETDNYPSLRVYPNPTTGELTIDNRQLIMDNVEIYNVMGQLLQSKIVNLQSKIEIDVSHLANGMYYLKVGNRVVKFVKE